MKLTENVMWKKEEGDKGRNNNTFLLEIWKSREDERIYLRPTRMDLEGVMLSDRSQKRQTL